MQGADNIKPEFLSRQIIENMKKKKKRIRDKKKKNLEIRQEPT